MPSMTEDQIREIVRDELLKLGVLGRLEGMEKLLERLVRVTERNIRAITKLGRQAEENTKAIIELRKQTEENTKAIAELRLVVGDLVKAVDELRLAVKGLAERMDGVEKRMNGVEESLGDMEDASGLLIGDLVGGRLPSWFKSQGIEVEEVKGGFLEIDGRILEFDVYVEAGGRLYLGEIKAMLREKDVSRFAEKIALVKSRVEGGAVPMLIFRAAKGRAVEIAKGLGIRVVKYKGGFFREV